MYNDFILIGPREDPAGIAGSNNASYAFKRIFRQGKAGDTTFISRADNSGTNVKELEIWASLGIKPSNKTDTWYLEAGAGMGTVLRMTNEKKAYTLTDRGTWLSFQAQLTNLKVMTQGEKILLNPYAVIPVNGTRFPARNYRMSVAFAKFLISNYGQQLIANYKRGGQSLFVSIARNYTAAGTLGFPNQQQEVAWYDSVNVEVLVIFIANVSLNEGDPVSFGLEQET
jgi:tungstate transport system substrate-binding protein